jgi:hypothetical protein
MKLPFKFLLPAVRRKVKKMRAECALQACPNTLLMRSVPQNRAGINVGRLWYCSVDCFAAAARPRFAELSSGLVAEMPHTPRMSIGLVMLSKGYLTDDQLRLAVSESQLNGEEMEATLIRLGLANERQLTVARAAQWGYPVFGQDRIGQAVETDIPATLLRMCSAAPLHHSATAKRVLLGFVHRVDHSLLHSLELITGCRAEPCFVTPTEFGEQMERLATDPDCEEVVFEEFKSPAQMARTVGGFAVEVVAREASFAQCRDYVWTRLSGKRRKIDVLFRVKNFADAGKRRFSTTFEENVSSLG